MAAGEWRPQPSTPDFERFELTGKRVGMIGLGIIGRRLVQLLQPFRCAISAHDPYVPPARFAGRFGIPDETPVGPRGERSDGRAGGSEVARHPSPARAVSRPAVG